MLLSFIDHVYLVKMAEYYPRFFRRFYGTNNFFLENHPYIKHQGHENTGNGYHLKKFLIIPQILLAKTMGNVWRQ